MKTIVSNLVLLFFALLVTGQEHVDVDIQLSNYQNDSLLIAYYFADKQLVHDTLISSDKSNFHWHQDTLVKPGMYLLVTFPDKNFVQVLMPKDDQEFEVKFDALDYSNHTFKGSEENQLFQDYVDFLAKQNNKSVELEARIKNAKNNNLPFQSYVEEMEVLDDNVSSYIDQVVEKNPNSITTLFLKTNIGTPMPEFGGTEQEQQMSRYLFYKDHYFDNVDAKHPAIIRTPLLDQRINYYLDKLTPQHPDSINMSLDKILNLFDQGSEGYKYYLSTYLNQYANTKIVGFDAVYVYLAENYYSAEKSPWVDEETINKITDNARMVKPVLLGKTGYDLQLYKEDGSPIKISEIDYEYLVVLFWAPDCGHCKKTMPDYIEFEKAFRDRGVKVLAVCTKLRDKTGLCWEYTNEKDMDGFIKVADTNHKSRYKIRYNVQTTPKLFILDKDRKILMKNIGAKQLAEVMDEIITVENAKKMQSGSN